jgi:hypothetical protein
MQDIDVTDIWNRLLSTPMQLMTEQERIVHAVNVFWIDFQQGGWLYNVAPDLTEHQQSWVRLRFLAAAVAAIGAPGVAERLTKIAEIVERVPESLGDGTWGGFLESVDPQDRISALEIEIDSELGAVYELLEAYTVAQLSNSASGDQ